MIMPWWTPQAYVNRLSIVQVRVKLAEKTTFHGKANYYLLV